jgi:DNA-binding transcriptional ArsR family regulator
MMIVFSMIELAQFGNSSTPPPTTFYAIGAGFEMIGRNKSADHKSQSRKIMSDSTTAAPTAAEIVEILGELEAYRDRLLNDMTDAAKKAKMSKAAMMQHIEPELKEIDLRIAGLKQLQAEQAGA